MKTKKSSIRKRSKPLAVANLEIRKDKVRLAIECTPEQRRYIKTFAALEDKSINDFVLSCVWKYAKCINMISVAKKKTLPYSDRKAKNLYFNGDFCPLFLI